MHHDSNAREPDAAQPGLEDARATFHVTPERLAWTFVLLGTLACAVRYGLGFPLIPDEAALAMNVARRGYEGLLGELQFGQMAPPVFLLAVEACTQLLGLHEWSLRLPAFVGAIGALLIFPLVARRALAGWAFVLAVAIFSVSYWPLRYSAEIKPYGPDMLLSCLWLLLALRWMASDRPWRWVPAMVPLALVGFGVSCPSVFVGGGAIIAMTLAGSRHGWATRIIQPGIVGLALLAGFLGTYRWLVPTRSDTAGWMVDYWQKAFPPTDSITDLGLYFLDVLTGELMPYPVGGENFASTATLLFVLVGTATLMRSKRWGLLALLLAPVALALVAGFLQRYPFGQPTRLQLYLAPIFCLLAGQGLAALLHGLQTALRAPSWRSPMRVACVLLAGISIVTMARDVLVPSKSSTDAALRDAARVLWGPARFGGPRPLSLREDLGAAFVAEPEGMHSELTRFLANFHMRTPGDEPATVEPGRRVEVVTFYVEGRKDPALRSAWIAGFERSYAVRFAGSATLTIPHVDNRENLLRLDEIEILRFEPAPASAAGHPEPGE